MRWKNSSFSSFQSSCSTNVSASSCLLVHSALLFACLFSLRVGRAFHSRWAYGKHSTQEHVSSMCCWYFIKSYQSAVSHLPTTLARFSPKSVTQHLTEFLKHLWPQLRGELWDLMCIDLSLYSIMSLIITHPLSNFSSLVRLPQFPAICTFSICTFFYLPLTFLVSICFSFDHFDLYITFPQSPSYFFTFSLSPPLLPSSFLFCIL